MWQPLSSPLVRALGGGELPPLTLPSRPPLAELPSIFDAADLELSVIQLSELRLEGRPRLARARRGDRLGRKSLFRDRPPARRR
jgi:hypothetical protein